MTTDPVDVIAAQVEAAVDRLEKYSDITMQAAKSNAEGSYRADDLLADLQRTWAMACEDVARVTAKVIDIYGLAADDDSEDE